MIPAQTVAHVFDAIQAAKTGAADFTTNFSRSKNDCRIGLRAANCLEQTNGAAFFFRKDRDFQHLYYSPPGALLEGLNALSALKSEKVVLDIVGKEAGLVEFLTKWEQSGFRRYTKLFRMARSPLRLWRGLMRGLSSVKLAMPNKS